LLAKPKQNLVVVIFSIILDFSIPEAG